MSLRQLSDKLDVPFNTLSRVERGSDCDLTNFGRIAAWLVTLPDEQPTPIPNDSRPVAELVIDDMRDRMAHGIETYGVALQAFNGRDQLRDLYEELLDACVYLRALMIELERKVEELETDVAHNDVSQVDV
jgi:hypothetical protein